MNHNYHLQEFDNDNGEITKWHKLLFSVLDMLIKTKSGIDNRSFWQKICHFSGGSGVIHLNEMFYHACQSNGTTESHKLFRAQQTRMILST